MLLPLEHLSKETAASMRLLCEVSVQIHVYEGALSISCSHTRTQSFLNLPFALKLVSVAFAALGLALPTFNFGFWKSFFFSFLFLALDPILSIHPLSSCLPQEIFQ